MEEKWLEIFVFIIMICFGVSQTYFRRVIRKARKETNDTWPYWNRPL